MRGRESREGDRDTDPRSSGSGVLSVFVVIFLWSFVSSLLSLFLEMSFKADLGFKRAAVTPERERERDAACEQSLLPIAYCAGGDQC